MSPSSLRLTNSSQYPTNLNEVLVLVFGMSVKHKNGQCLRLSFTAVLNQFFRRRKKNIPAHDPEIRTYSLISLNVNKVVTFNSSTENVRQLTTTELVTCGNNYCGSIPIGFYENLAACCSVETWYAHSYFSRHWFLSSIGPVLVTYAGARSFQHPNNTIIRTN